MLIRQCPVCDQEMKGRFWCKYCRSFVRKPNVIDVHYNMEMRNQTEEDCSYSDHRTEPTKKRMKLPEIDSNRTNPRPVSGPAAEELEKSVKWRPIILTVITIIIFNLIPVIVNKLGERDSSLTLEPDDYRGGAYVETDENIFNYGDEESYRLSLDDVFEHYDECTIYDHMDLTLDELIEVLYGVMPADDYDFSTEHLLYEYKDSVTGEITGTSFDSTFSVYTAEDFQSSYNYTIGFDPVSERIHYFAVLGYDKETVYEQLNEMLDLIELNILDSRKTLEDIYLIQDDEEYFFAEVNGYNIYFTAIDAGDNLIYYISINK